MVLLLSGPVRADELRPAYLELQETSPGTMNVLWKVPARGEFRLSLDVRFPETCQRQSEPVSSWAGGAFIQRWTMTCPEGLAGEPITVEGLSNTLTDVLVRVQWFGGATETFRLYPENPSFSLQGSPDWRHVATTFTQLGAEHILLGVDHLLFVLGLLLIVRQVKTLIKTITAFTVAHSITLALAVFGVLHVPSRPVDAAIALSIVFLAAEIVYAKRGRAGLTVRYPWMVAFAFGLLHGLGFAGALTSLGLPQGDIPIALLFFNLGVELGQLLFVLYFLIVAWAFRTLQVLWPTWTQVIPAYTLGTLATYWFVGRLLVLFPVLSS